MLKRKKETEVEPKSVYQVNENFINIIQPSSIDFDDRTTALGENVGKIYAISRYPDRNDYGWLAPLCNLEGTATTIEFHYTESDNLIAASNGKRKGYYGKENRRLKKTDTKVGSGKGASRIHQYYAACAGYGSGSVK